jgi:hypothetical protein
MSERKPAFDAAMKGIRVYKVCNAKKQKFQLHNATTTACFKNLQVGDAAIFPFLETLFQQEDENS